MAIKLVLFLFILLQATACVAPAKLDIPAGRSSANTGPENTTLDGTVSTVAGSASTGIVDGIGLAARMNQITAMVYHPTQKLFYFADYDSAGVIRTFDPESLEVTTIAGNASDFGNVEGVGTAARMGMIGGMAINSEGDIFFTDYQNHNVKKLEIDTLAVKIHAGTSVSGFQNSTLLNAMFDEPLAIGIDSADNIYVGDLSNRVIRVIRTNGAVITHVGKQGNYGLVDAPALDAEFTEFFYLYVDEADTLYLSDLNTIRSINPASYVTTIAGSTTGIADYVDDIGTDARFNSPFGIVKSLDKKYLYIADSQNYVIRKFDIDSAEVSTFVGEPGDSQVVDGNALTARFRVPRILVFDDNGYLYVAEDRMIRKIE